MDSRGLEDNDRRRRVYGEGLYFLGSDYSRFSYRISMIRNAFMIRAQVIAFISDES